jgi:hypothetical protein
MPAQPPSIFGLLKKAALKEHLGHGLLLVSRSVVAPTFVEGLKDFVGFLMCTQREAGTLLDRNQTTACGRCESCVALKGTQDHEGLHPDLFWLRPDGKVGYSIDQIKALRSSLSIRRSMAYERVVVLENAEALGAGGGAAANALLKLLEEPRDGTRLILTSERPEGLLATIRSRCQLFRVAIPSAEESAGQLDASNLDSWAPLWAWIARGMPSQEWPVADLPPDLDSYFKERETAIDELRGVFFEAWRQAREAMNGLRVEEQRRAIQWFESFEELLLAFRFHGQGALQWSAFKSRARVGSK